tara:strand:+ start:538 stop:1116 length:579 start_codon:yes stop_codon:yes gene_type:complete
MNNSQEFKGYAKYYINNIHDKLHMLSLIISKKYEKEFEKKTNIGLKNEIFKKIIEDLYEIYELVCNVYFVKSYPQITELDCLMYCIIELLLKYYIFELYENKDIFNKLDNLYSSGILYYYDDNIPEPMFVSLFIETREKINIIEENNKIRREYSRVINSNNTDNEFNAFFTKYCGLKKFIGTKLLLFLPILS